MYALRRRIWSFCITVCIHKQWGTQKLGSLTCVTVPNLVVLDQTLYGRSKEIRLKMVRLRPAFLSSRDIQRFLSKIAISSTPCI